MDANGLRRAFTTFFAERGHAIAPSSGLIPHHPRAPLFTNAGMNQFLPYLLGEELPPHPRMTSVQKCVRIKGKHDDIELIGRTTRHFTFFEMLGNWSFGDYFKQGAIEFAWEFVTERLGLEGERIWVTVYETDEDAAAIWRDRIGLPAERIQRMGADNFWEMGDTGPCGPCSELYYDRGEAFGEPGGPAYGGDERYLEFWNLVFMQYDRQPDGTLRPLPKGNIDTGAGLERLLSILNELPSAWDTDTLRPVIAAAEAATRRTYGSDPEADVALRILADHARSTTFLVNDGVFPSNEDRGYVLRRLIRRAVRHAFQLGVDDIVMPSLVRATVEVMGEAYPDLKRNESFIAGVLSREEQRFRATLRTGLALLQEALASGGGVIEGDVAFRLHDTHGFPIELTREIAAEKGVTVDEEGFAAAMARQKQLSLEGKKKEASAAAHLDEYRELIESFGPTQFLGYTEESVAARVLAVLPVDPPEGAGSPHLPHVEIFLDRTPFYAEGGGQVGDTGLIRGPHGAVNVLDTTYALPGLNRHTAVVLRGQISPGEEVEAEIDVDRRAAIRRNHTGTHLLHAALREVLGTHVKQAGSLVAPERLRFDFSHYGPLTAEEIARVEDFVNERILADETVRSTVMPKTEADRLGAIAFFGDKYGDVVRVVQAGSVSTELCGGTHVSALGQIGPVRITSEGSIGSNLRRLEATTGTATLARLRHDETVIGQAAQLLKASPEELLPAIERRLGELRSTQDELKAVRQAGLREQAAALAAAAVGDGGAVVARRDGLDQRQLQELAVNVRSHPGVRAVVLGGSPAEGKVALVAAVAKGSDLVASDLIAEAARIVGGGGGKNPELAMAGGRDPSRLDEALAAARRALGLA
ncbi:MAG TPA: alanine--tRNA ligase [Acidimicrobiales bacterium]|jgi:alanyl-tRNA synthetase|nr:alanine--tRNA ligase [Acidimicrobiales bacterium]